MIKLLIILPIINNILYYIINKQKNSIFFKLKYLWIRYPKYFKSAKDAVVLDYDNLQTGLDLRLTNQISFIIKKKILYLITLLFVLFNMIISFIILLQFNSNSPEIQFRQLIDLKFMVLTIGIDGLSLSLILITTIIYPIIILLIKEKIIPQLKYYNKKFTLNNMIDFTRYWNDFSEYGVLNIGRIKDKTPKLEFDKIWKSNKQTNSNSRLANQEFKQDNAERNKKYIEYINSNIEMYDNHSYNNVIILLNFIYSILIIVLTSLDLFIFYTMFEIILIPMYLLVGLIGSINKRKQAIYTFLYYSLIGSLIMLISIIIMNIKYGTLNNELLLLKLTIDYNNNYSNVLSIFKFFWLSFFICFAVKIPVIPFHSWLPLMHTEAPTIGSVILAAILLKIGSYGIIRYNLTLFKDTNQLINLIDYYQPLILTIMIISVIYGSFITIAQLDFKKIIAYSSIIHMNFSLIGIFSNDFIGLQGGYFVLISHALISSGLFILIGIVYERYHSRIYLYYKGLANVMPLYAVFLFMLIIFNSSIPFTSSFISELLILISTVKYNIIITVLLLLSIFFATIYNFFLLNRILFGKVSNYINSYIDLTLNEILTLIPLFLLSLLLGIFPRLLLNIFSFSILSLI